MKDGDSAMVNRITLRPLREEDIDDRYLAWFKDDAVTEFLEAKNLSRQDCIDFLVSGRESGVRFLYAICDVQSGLHIGNVKIGDVNRKSMVSDLVTLIGDRNFWGRGLATEAIRAGNKIAFEEHGIRKLNGGMYAGNIASIKAYIRAGWVIEAILHGHYLLDGKVTDRVVVSCFNPVLFPTPPTFPKQFDEITSRL